MLARERGKVRHFIFIVTAHDDGIDFDRVEARIFRGCNSFKHSLQNIDTGHLFESVGLQTVEAYRDAIEAGFFQTLRAMRQEITVSCERQIEQAAIFQLR